MGGCYSSLWKSQYYGNGWMSPHQLKNRRQTCRVITCIEDHQKHYCKYCKIEDVNHWSKQCPLKQEYYKQISGKNVCRPNFCQNKNGNYKQNSNNQLIIRPQSNIGLKITYESCLQCCFGSNIKPSKMNKHFKNEKYQKSYTNANNCKHHPRYDYDIIRYQSRDKSQNSQKI